MHGDLVHQRLRQIRNSSHEDLALAVLYYTCLQEVMEYSGYDRIVHKCQVKTFERLEQNHPGLPDKIKEAAQRCYDAAVEDDLKSIQRN